MQSNDPLVEELNRQLRLDGRRLQRRLDYARSRADRSSGPMAHWWRRQARLLDRDRAIVDEALRRQRLHDEAPETSRKLFLFSLARAVGLNVNGLEDRCEREVRAKLLKRLRRPAWIWKYQYRFWRLLAVTAAVAAIFVGTYAFEVTREEVIVFTRIASGGVTFLGVVMLSGLAFERRLR